MRFTRHLRPFHLAAILLAPLAVVSAAGQEPEVANAVPLPSPLTSAAKLFLGNAGDQENADCLRAYNVFYTGVGALGRYTMVADPAAADLVLELHYEIDLGQSIASNDSRRSVRQFRVVIIDPHTHTVLWSLTERTNYALFQKNRNKNLDETVSALVSDFNSLTSAQPPNNKSRVSHPHLP